MSALHTEHYKEYRKDSFVAQREQRLARELELSKQADIVACIGPRLYRHMKDELSAAQASPFVLRINCGFERSSDVRDYPEHPRILCLGRSDSIKVKGLDLFAKAAGELSSRWLQCTQNPRKLKPEFIVRGANQEQAAGLQNELRQLSVFENRHEADIHVRPYTTSVEELQKDLRAASLFVMPSREEGFGLVACEALSLGIPIVVTSHSGLAETLYEVAHESNLDLSPMLVDHSGLETELPGLYADKMFKVLAQPAELTDLAKETFERLHSTNSWDCAAESLRASLIHGLDQIPDDGVGDGSEADTPGYSEFMARNKHTFNIPGVKKTAFRRAFFVYTTDLKEKNFPDQIEDIDIVVRDWKGDV